MHSLLEIKVIPGASKTEISGWLGECVKIKVAAPPEKGKANRAVIKVLSEKLGISKDQITIVRGETSQRKVCEIHGVSQEQLVQCLPAKRS